MEDTEQADKEWDHGTNDEFYEYYSNASLTEKTRERFTGVMDMMHRVLGPEKAALSLEVADIGCGAGSQCLLWAERGHRVHGLDINRKLVELGGKRAVERHLEIDFQVGSATNLPFEDSSMDVCLAPELLEHVEEWEPCMREFTRVLKPGGLLYVSTTNKLCPKQQEFDLPFYSWYPAPMKRRYERLSVTTRPELVNHAKYPAVHWFTYYGLRTWLAKRGFDSQDRFDVTSLDDKSTVGRFVIRSIRALPPIRLLAQMATPGTTVVARKRGG